MYVDMIDYLSVYTDYCRTKLELWMTFTLSLGSGIMISNVYLEKRMKSWKSQNRPWIKH